MSETTRCKTCVGSKKIMGGGMIYIDCPECDGEGQIYSVMTEDSEEYKRSVEKIKALDDKMTDTDAKKLLDEELGKINNGKVGKKRRK